MSGSKKGFLDAGDLLRERARLMFALRKRLGTGKNSFIFVSVLNYGIPFDLCGKHVEMDELDPRSKLC